MIINKNIVKKAVSFILSLCLFGGYAYAAVPYDVEDEYLIKVLRALSCFDILYQEGDSGNFRPNDFVTRAEAVADVLKLTGREVVVHEKNVKQIFYDVDVKHEYFDVIQTAAEYGIIEGYGKSFEPERSISYPELMKILCGVLGYDTAAEHIGGFPSGYMTTAAQAGLTDNVKSTADGLCRRDYAVILYNALTVPIMKLSVDGETTRIEPDKEHTILSDIHDCFSGKGVVTANSLTTIYTPGGIGVNSVRIGDAEFYAGETDAEELIGCYTEYYAKENKDGEYTLIGIWADESRLVHIDSTGILQEESTLDELCCEINGGKVKKYRIEKNADLIYNGQACSLDDVRLITPDTGTVTLSDTDNNGIYDILIVVGYTVRIAQNASKSSENIIYMDNKGSLDMSENAFDDITVLKDNNEIEYTDIKEWDVLHLAVPPEPEKGRLRIIVSSATASGNVDFIGEDSITVAGTEYDFGKGYDAVRLRTVKAGMNVIALLDIFGRIVDIQPAANTEVCGYLFNVSYAEDEEKAYFSIYTENGEWISAVSAEKIQLNDKFSNASSIVDLLQCTGDANGVRVDGANKMVDIWGRYINYAGGNPANGFETVSVGVDGCLPLKKITDRQMILYSLNSNGEIKSIRTADASDKEDAFVTHGDYTASPGIQWREGMRAFYIYRSAETIYPSFYADEDTVMFIIPFGEPEDKDMYSVKRADDTYLHSDDYNCYAKTYGFKNDDLWKGIPYMMVQAGGGKEQRTAPIAVKDVFSAVGDDGTVGYKLKGYLKGQEVEYYSEDIKIFQKNNGKLLSFGDFVEFDLKEDGSLKSVYNGYGNDILHNVSVPGADVFGAYGTYRTSYRSMTGIVDGVDYAKRRLALDTGETSADGKKPIVGLWRTWTTSYVYIINLDEKSITVGNINDITVNDYVTCAMDSFGVRAVAVYRGL